MGERQIVLKDLAGIDVLIVDDSAGIRQMLATVLKSFGVGSVRQAANGEEALSILRAKPPKLLIVDWDMRPMDGMTLIRAIRNKANFPNCFIPVIVLTAHSQPHVVRAALKHGANQFLSKPLVPQTLLNRMLWALNDKRPYVERDGYFVHAPPGNQKDGPDSLGVPQGQAVPAPNEMWMIE